MPLTVADITDIDTPAVPGRRLHAAFERWRCEALELDCKATDALTRE